ncbi:glycosyl hydrolase [Steroidobacter agaridevorans]|uniref:Glycosyl hydrolase n=2 Tax=Steroidobacter agaridevorans TaxID=2695856 RepID=A0A829YHZ8_9GAMM|nr:glycosyl hydrolase [Steroidobacter agaridevorans]
MFRDAQDEMSDTADMTHLCGSSAPPGVPATDLHAKRANALIARMTLAEKVSLVSTHCPLFSPLAQQYNMPLATGFNAGIPRLSIPALRMTDSGLGVANILNKREGDTATALPSALSTAASFDSSIARAGGAMVGAEARAKTFNVLLAGAANITRDPWAGRNFEYLGEDPLLVGTLAGAAIEGVQSNNIASTVKHFVLNPQETGRMIMDARIDPAALRESDLLAFEIAIELGQPAAVMGPYNKINGEFGCENDELLNGVLKRDWGFRGWVMSDWGATHSTEKAALAGLDQESGMEFDVMLNGAIFFTDRLLEAVRENRVPVARLDDMVRRILIGMIDKGLFDQPVPNHPQPIDTESHALVAQRVAEAGTVLLRNERNTLPLGPAVKSVVVIGGHADVGVLSGGGSSQVRSVGGVPIEIGLESGDAAIFARQTWHASSPLNAIRALAPGAEVSFLDGTDKALATKAARAADVAIVFATEWRTEAVDLQSLSLPDDQDELIAAVANVNPRTVVVLETGGPVLMPWLNRVSAVLAAWYPGQRGGEAIANILFGKVNPSGRLPITFPAAATQAPRPEPAGLEQLRARDAAREAGNDKVRIAPFSVDYHEGANVGYRWYELKNQQPLFAFGYGLSYTTFSYSNLASTGSSAPQVSLDITNTGKVAGADVPQIYVRATGADGTTTWRLAGFARVEIAPGATKRVLIPLEPRTYARWDVASRQWVFASGELQIAVGRSAADLVLLGTMTCSGGLNR